MQNHKAVTEALRHKQKNVGIRKGASLEELLVWCLYVYAMECCPRTHYTVLQMTWLEDDDTVPAELFTIFPECFETTTSLFEELCNKLLGDEDRAALLSLAHCVTTESRRKDVEISSLSGALEAYQARNPEAPEKVFEFAWTLFQGNLRIGKARAASEELE